MRFARNLLKALIVALKDKNSHDNMKESLYFRHPGLTYINNQKQKQKKNLQD